MSGKIPDLTGQTFGLWSVIAPAESDRTGRTRYLCRCTCGKERIVSADNLRRGVSTSCGHTRFEVRREDLTGQRFSRLTAIRYVDTRGANPIWECVCVCGNRCEVAANNLKNGHTQSCGCQKAEAQQDTAARLAGQAASPKCGKVDTNARAKKFTLQNKNRTWSGRNLSNFVRKHGDLFGIDSADECQISRVAQRLYSTQRDGTFWHGWKLKWEEEND